MWIGSIRSDYAVKEKMKKIFDVVKNIRHYTVINFIFFSTARVFYD